MPQSTGLALENYDLGGYRFGFSFYSCRAVPKAFELDDGFVEPGI